MEEQAKKILQKAVAKSDKDIDEVRSIYDAKLEEMKANLSSEVAEEQVQRHAATVVKNDITQLTQTYNEPDVEELPVLTLGYEKRESEYFFTDGDAIIGLGIVNPSEDSAGVSTFLLDLGDGLDEEITTSAFEPLNTVRIYAGRRRVGSRDGEPNMKKGGKPTYICESTSESKIEEVDPAEVDEGDVLKELPSDKEEKRTMIHEHFITEEDHVTLQNYADHLSMTNSDGYPVAFGADVKRIRGQIADVYRDFDINFGTMTILDDTVMDETDVDEDLMTDNTRTPGLQVLLDPALAQYGTNSLVDVYGILEQRTDDEGAMQIQMNAFGVVPIVEYEIDESGTNSEPDDDVEEETI